MKHWQPIQIGDAYGRVTHAIRAAVDVGKAALLWTLFEEIPLRERLIFS